MWDGSHDRAKPQPTREKHWAINELFASALDPIKADWVWYARLDAFAGVKSNKKNVAECFASLRDLLYNSSARTAVPAPWHAFCLAVGSATPRVRSLGSSAKCVPAEEVAGGCFFCGVPPGGLDDG